MAEVKWTDLASLQDAVNRIMLNPHLYPTVDLDVRRIDCMSLGISTSATQFMPRLSK